MHTLSISIPVTATLLMLAGCATTDPLPRDLPDMQTLYDAHRAGESTSDLQTARAQAVRPLHNAEADLRPWSRDSVNEIEHLFPRLPNPTLLLYIDPHLSEAGYPVPGYTTAFPLYERVEYALPGEVPPPARPVLLR